MNFDKREVKLVSNFTSIPFDYLLISWVTNYALNRGVLTCLSYRELQALNSLSHMVWLKFTIFLSEIMKKSCGKFLPHFRVFVTDSKIRQTLIFYLN